MNHNNKTFRLVERTHIYIYESNPSFYFEADMRVAYLHRSRQKMATFPLFIFEEQQEWTYIFIVLIKFHSVHQLVVHLFCFQFFASTRSPARQTIDIYTRFFFLYDPLELLPQSLRHVLVA